MTITDPNHHTTIRMLTIAIKDDFMDNPWSIYDVFKHDSLELWKMILLKQYSQFLEEGTSTRYTHFGIDEKI